MGHGMPCPNRRQWFPIVIPSTPTPTPTTWTLAPVRPAEHELFGRLAELYLYDFSEFEGWNIDERGRFSQNQWAERLLTTPARHAFLLRIGGEPAGFSVIDERSPLRGGSPHHYIAEFFVLRKFRRGGYGEAMARAVFDHFPGAWHVLQVPKNTPAQRFWRRVIGTYTGGRYQEWVTTDGDTVQEFTTNHREPNPA